MRQSLTPRDRLLLLTALPLFLVVFALHVQESARTGLAQLPVYATWQSGTYPVVGGYRLETDSSNSGLLPGDRLISVGGRDLRNQGYVGFDAIALSLTRPGHPVPLVFERDGVRRTVLLESRPHPEPWAVVPILLLVAMVCVLLLVGAPGQPDAQRLYLFFMAFAIAQAAFYGGPEWKTWMAAGVWNLAGPLMFLFGLRAARMLPSELREEDRVSPLIPWLAAGAYVVLVRFSYSFGAPLPSGWVPAASFASHGVITLIGIAILAHNYLLAAASGRRRLRWLLLGSILGAVPLVVASFAPLLLPDWEKFPEVYAVSFASVALWMLAVMLAVLHDHAFDVDRVIASATAWAVAAAGTVIGLVVVLPATSERAASLLGIDPMVARVGLAAAIGALMLPLGSRLRPGVERLLFPERIALQEGADALADVLAGSDEPAALLDAATRGLARLFGADTAALWLRSGGGVEERLAIGSGHFARAAVESSTALPRYVRPGNVPAALAPPGSLAVPIARGASPDAWVLLGPKDSGDVYTSGDAAVATALAARVEAAWVRLEKRVADREVRDKTNLLASAGHDLRQPLHAVALFTEALQGKLTDPELRALVDRIGASTQDLDEMLTSLLDRSGLDAGAVRPSPGDIALCDVFEALERELAPQAHARGLRLRFVPTALVVHSDRLLLVRILRNLVSNAVRYTREGAVCVAARARGERVAIEVRDSGPGIAPQDQREIFRAFRQLSRAQSSGLGLGLSIVQDLAALLGHEVTLRSAPGRGSTFSVWVPRVTCAPAVAGRPSAPHGSAGGRAGSAGSRVAAAGLGVRRVLVIDDDPRVREATRVLLEGWGCEVREAASGLEARATVATWCPDFVLADYAFRDGEDGLGVVAALRGDLGPALPAAFVTGETDPERLRALRSQGFRVLRKPVQPARLRALLSAPDLLVMGS